MSGKRLAVSARVADGLADHRLLVGTEGGGLPLVESHHFLRAERPERLLVEGVALKQ